MKVAALEKTAQKEAERVKAAEAAEAKATTDKKATEEKLAALSTPAAENTESADLPRSLQVELKRVGCSSSAPDGKWTAASQKALDLFNKHAGMKLEVKVANIDALDAVKGKTSRVCPMICEQGFKADGDRCTKITCRAGYEVGDENTCEKIEVKKPTAKRDGPKREKRERSKTEAAPAKPQASGQIFCHHYSGGCRPVSKGCRIVQRSSGSGEQIEVCKIDPASDELNCSCHHHALAKGRTPFFKAGM